jgi:hypothetical protein
MRSSGNVPKVGGKADRFNFSVTVRTDGFACGLFRCQEKHELQKVSSQVFGESGLISYRSVPWNDDRLIRDDG